MRKPASARLIIIGIPFSFLKFTNDSNCEKLSFHLLLDDGEFFDHDQVAQTTREVVRRAHYQGFSKFRHDMLSAVGVRRNVPNCFVFRGIHNNDDEGSLLSDGHWKLDAARIRGESTTATLRETIKDRLWKADTHHFAGFTWNFEMLDPAGEDI